MIKKSLILVSVLLSFQASADIAKELHEFFNQVTDSNITPGGAYKGQEGGFYTGGSLFARTPSRQIQLLNMQVPKIEAGCSGIDLHMGGFGYINSQKMIDTLKAIGANSVGYAFSLALKQLSPQIMSQIEELQAWMNEANWNNINSCQTAARLMNNAAACFHESTVKTCIQEEIRHGKDYFSARSSCQTQAKVNAGNRQAKDRGELVIDNMNLAWRMIQQNPLSRTLEQNLKFLLMSLTGTIVIKTEGDASPRPKTYHSKLQTSDLFYQLSTGKDLIVYSCLDEDCLNLTDKVLTLDKDHTFFGKVHKLLKGMEEKVIRDNDPLTPQEKAFLESTSLPVYKMLNVYSAFGRGSSLIFPDRYAEVIAMDILARYLESSINRVLEMAHDQDLPENLKKAFLKMAEMARTQAQQLRLLQLQKTGTVDDMVAKVQLMEKQITALVSNQILRSLYGL